MSSEILRFYSNANVLITGGTGFLGKLVIQKLLRACDDIDGIYLIIREKKNQNASDRLNDVFKDPVFNRLKEERPKFTTKVHSIEGDCAQPGLGLNQHNRELLTEKINIVFHCAASMSMDAKIQDAVRTNIHGLTELLDLCHEMLHLKSMVCVSTAYSNCNHYLIEEKFYDTPIEAKTLIKLMQELKESVLDEITPGLIDKFPNTYCFTKAVAEDILHKHSRDLPVGLFRPSIIMPTYYDPVPGWSSNVYGPLGVMLATGLGILRVFFCSPNKQFDLVPGDYCVNALICTAWEVHQKCQNTKNGLQTDVAVYNYSGGSERNITWTQLNQYSDGYEYPLKNAVWITSLILTSNVLWYNFLWIFLHIIPGYLLDAHLLISGQKPRLIKAYKKIAKFTKVLAFFSTNEWNIINKNVCSLWDRLEEVDKKIFPFDMDLINYKQFIQNTCLGLKLYILKETLDNADAEKRRYQRMLTFHKLIKYAFLLIVVVICYKVTHFCISMFYE